MRKRLTGTVTGDKMNKSRRVEVQRVFRHPKYGKIIRQRLVCHAHDEGNVSKQGDVVEIVESRPLSKLKRWTVVTVVRGAANVAEMAPEATT
jgi:small subunit ribosomal protein S17